MPRADFPAGSRSLSGVARLIARYDLEPELVLERSLEPIDYRYDFCVFDSAPEFDFLLVNAIATTDEILLAVSMESLAVLSVAALLGVLERYIKRSNAELRYVLPTKLEQWLMANRGLTLGLGCRALLMKDERIL